MMLMPLSALVQLCSGLDENAVGTCSELVFAPIDASFADDAPLLPSGFRIIPLDCVTVSAFHIRAELKIVISLTYDDYYYEIALVIVFVTQFYNVYLGLSIISLQNYCLVQGNSSPNRTLDLASALEVGPTKSKVPGDSTGSCGSLKSVMTIALQFAFENHLQENVATMARQYIRNIISSVQRVALALSPSRLGCNGLHSPPGSPEAVTLAHWICHSYRYDAILLQHHEIALAYHLRHVFMQSSPNSCEVWNSTFIFNQPYNKTGLIAVL